MKDSKNKSVFVNELDREHLLAYFMGCAITGLCRAGDYHSTAEDIAKEARSIAEIAVNNYLSGSGE